MYAVKRQKYTGEKHISPHRGIPKRVAMLYDVGRNSKQTGKEPVNKDSILNTTNIILVYPEPIFNKKTVLERVEKLPEEQEV